MPKLMAHSIEQGTVDGVRRSTDYDLHLRRVALREWRPGPARARTDDDFIDSSFSKGAMHSWHNAQVQGGQREI